MVAQGCCAQEVTLETKSTLRKSQPLPYSGCVLCQSKAETSSNSSQSSGIQPGQPRRQEGDQEKHKPKPGVTSKDQARKEEHKQSERVVRPVGHFMPDPTSRKVVPTHHPSVPHSSYLSRVGDISPGDTSLCFSQEQSKVQAPAFVHNEQCFQDRWAFPARNVLSNSIATV